MWQHFPKDLEKETSIQKGKSSKLECAPGCLFKKKKKKKVICLGNIISAKAIQGLIVKMTSQLHTAFHPQDSKRGLKSEILSTCTQTHTFGRIHTYVTLFTSLMKVECTGRCLPAAHHSPSSSLRQEAKDTRSKRNCRGNPGR